MKDRILESHVEDFAARHSLDHLPISTKMHHFVNYCVLSGLSIDAFDVADVSTDGTGDIGVDGAALLVEGHIVNAREDIDFFRERIGRLNADFVFIQSKSGTSFKAADIGTFCFGVRSFFDDTLPPKTNDVVRDAFDLKTYLYENSVDMEKAPSCKLYYAAAGEWKDDVVLQDRINKETDLLRDTGLFSTVTLFPLDVQKLRELYRSTRNRIVTEITFDRHTILPAISGITEAYLGILPCTEYLKLIVDSDGQIERALFYDNVRDFQGLNPVNREIAETLADADKSSQFVLLNNGVTIVAKSITKVGAKFKITDYQIVNGCQTSHVIYAQRDKVTPDVFLPVKLVVTDCTGSA